VAVKVAGLLRERGPALGVVSSFSLAAVDAARAAVPEVPTGWLTLPGYDQLTAVATAAEHGHTALHAADAAVTPEVVAAARAAGLEVLAWTVNEVARMEELASWGVEAVITDLVGRVPLPGTPGSG
jgi:glycerophosphoryl diester phosphodiesterase